MVKNGISPNPIKCINKDFRNFYKKETEDIIDKRLHEYDNDRIIHAFLQKMGEKLITNRSGIFIEKMGYFFVYAHPYKFQPRLGKNHLRPYLLTFIPTRNSIFKYWGMDFKFIRSLEQGLKKNIKKGYRYLNMIKSINGINEFYQGSRTWVKSNKTKGDVI